MPPLASSPRFGIVTLKVARPFDLEQEDMLSHLKYPHCPHSDHVDVLHGVSVADPYRWLEELDSESTRAWVQAENQLTNDFLAQIPEREHLVRRITELWDFEKFGVPFQAGGRIFFTRNDGLQNQSVLYWLDGLDGEPQELLDPNTLSADGTVALTGYAVSEDGRLLAYALSSAGSDWKEWRVRRVDDGCDLEDVVQWSKFSGASWTHDGGGFFYSRYDAPAEGLAYKGANYDQKLCYHRLVTPQDQDELVYERPDHKEWGFGAQVSEDGRYLVVAVWQGTQRENGLFYRDLQENGPFIELLNQFDAAYEFIGNDGSLFYLKTDLDAPLSRVIAIDIRRPQREHWQTIIPQAADALQGASLVGGLLVAGYLHDAYSQVKIWDKQGQLVHQVALPGIGSVYGFEGRQSDHDTFYMFTGFTSPGVVYRYDMQTGDSTVFRRPQLAFDPDAFVTEQVFYDSKDGTHVPMFLVRRKDVQPTPDTPTFLYGYGGFDISLTPAFSVRNLVWLEMGGLFAQPNLRGGGEYGKAWHDAGRKLNKQNVFDDFIAAAEWLIANGLTSTPRLVIGGGSNGGLLVGACLTQRPDLFGACLPAVGVLDMLRFHLWTIGWAWVSDYGSPDTPEEFRALLAYSPYHNVKPGTAFPPTLIVTADHDDRVFPAHSFKFAAALQHAQAGPAPILIRIETRAGHGAGKPTSKIIQEVADMWAFALYKETARV